MTSSIRRDLNFCVDLEFIFLLMFSYTFFARNPQSHVCITHKINFIGTPPKLDAKTNLRSNTWFPFTFETLEDFTRFMDWNCQVCTLPLWLNSNFLFNFTLISPGMFQNKQINEYTVVIFSACFSEE